MRRDAIRRLLWLGVSVAFAVQAWGAATNVIRRAADYLVAHQLGAGHWGEEGFVGECTIGLCRAYELLVRPEYRQAAEKAGTYFLDQAGYDGDQGRYLATNTLYAAEAYALSRLSRISNNPLDNFWRTALENFFEEVRQRSYSTSNFIDDIVMGYGSKYEGTALYDLSRFTAAAAYVGDQDLAVWRQGVIDLLGEIDNNDDMPVTALGAAVWALALSGGLDSTVISGSSTILNGKALNELPDLLASLQAPDGSFAWYFDGSFPGFTEPTVMGSLALRQVGGYESNIQAAIAVLATGVNPQGGAYFEIGKSESGSAFYYAGETLEVLEPLAVVLFRRGFINRDDRVDLGDDIFMLNYIFAGGAAPGCMDAADVNDDGELDIADPIYLLGWQFRDGPPPPPPFEICGADTTPDDLDCATFPLCAVVGP